MYYDYCCSIGYCCRSDQIKCQQRMKWHAGCRMIPFIPIYINKTLPMRFDNSRRGSVWSAARLLGWLCSKTNGQWSINHGRITHSDD